MQQIKIAGMSLSKGAQSHEDAVNKTIFYLKRRWKFMIRPGYPILHNGYRHRYDIVAFLNDDELILYNEDKTIDEKIPVRKLLNMSDKDLVYSDYKNLLDDHVALVIEMDNLTSHTHTEHLIADGIAKDNAFKVFKNMQFIRLLKEEVNGNEQHMYEYFAKHIDIEMDMVCV